MIQKIIKSLLIATLLFTGSLAFAGEHVTSAAVTKEVKKVETERYYQIDRKWQVDVEFKDDSQERFYVYEIDSQDELESEIAKGIKKHYGIELSTDELLSVLQVEKEKSKTVDESNKNYDADHDDKKYIGDSKDTDEKDKKSHNKDEQELIRALIKIIILMVMSQDGADVDVSELLKLL